MRMKTRLLILLAVAVYAMGCGTPEEGHVPPEGTVFPQDRVITGGEGGYGSGTTGGTEADIASGMRATLAEQSLSVGEANVNASSSTAAGLTQVSGVLPDGSGRNHTLNFGFQTLTGTYAVVGLESWLTPPPDFTRAGFQYIRADAGSSTGTNSTDVSGTLTIRSTANQRVVGTFSGAATIDGESVSITAEFNVPRMTQP